MFIYIYTLKIDLQIKFVLKRTKILNAYFISFQPGSVYVDYHFKQLKFWNKLKLSTVVTIPNLSKIFFFV